MQQIDQNLEDLSCNLANLGFGKPLSVEQGGFGATVPADNQPQSPTQYPGSLR